MRVKRFESKIRREMFRFLAFTILIILVITLVLFSFYSVNVRRIRLERAAENYSAYLNRSIDEYENVFYVENKELFLEFFSGEVERNQIFSAFYTFNSTQDLKSDLLILDEDSEILLSTHAILEEDHSFLHYVNIVSEHERGNSETTTRIYRALDGEQYLLLFYPFTEQNDTLGFGISIINGNEVPSLGVNSSVSYAIYDQYQNVFSTNTPQLIQDSRGKVDLSVLGENNGILFGQYDVIEQTIGTNLFIVTYQELDSYLTVLYRTVIGIVIITVLAVIQSFYFSKKVSGKMGRSLQIVSREMEKVKNDSSYLLKVKTDDEFELLAEQVNKMLVRLTQINDENILLSQLNLKAEKKKLDAQFNPHFLANTLESIRSAMYVDPEIASKLILKTNKILRYSIDEETSEITLAEDMEYLKDYLEINRTRLEDFQYKVELDPQLYSLVVPKLFLLPLIENSLKYGYKNRHDLIVFVKISKYQETITIRVIDNGKALSSNNSQIINKALRQTNEVTKQHGLKNTKQRLELFYSKTNFRIFTKLGFTVIEIKIKEE